MTRITRNLLALTAGFMLALGCAQSRALAQSAVSLYGTATCRDLMAVYHVQNQRPDLLQAALSMQGRVMSDAKLTDPHLRMKVLNQTTLWCASHPGNDVAEVVAEYTFLALGLPLPDSAVILQDVPAPAGSPHPTCADLKSAIAHKDDSKAAFQRYADLLGFQAAQIKRYLGDGPAVAREAGRQIRLGCKLYPTIGLQRLIAVMGSHATTP